jgi:hypothetical protein
MFHPSTERLIDYWRERRGGFDVPLRSSVDPSDFLDVLPQIFIVGRDRAGLYPFRLSGGFVSDLHRQDLRGVNMLSLWTPFDRAPLQATLERCRTRPQPFVVRSEIRADGVGPVGMEIFFAPLASSNGETDRFLGLYQPTAMIHRLMGRAANELAIRAIEGPSHVEAPRLRLAALNGRLIA